MANEQNLIPFTELTEEQQRELARKGGKASAKARKQKQTMKEILEIFLEMPINAGRQANIKEIKSFAEVRGKNISVEQAMTIQQIQKALKGDTKAYELIRDTIGQKPDDNVNVTGAVPVIISGEDKLEN